MQCAPSTRLSCGLEEVLPFSRRGSDWTPAESSLGGPQQGGDENGGASQLLSLKWCSESKTSMSAKGSELCVCSPGLVASGKFLPDCGSQ